MRLKRLVCRGFKSFAERTEFEFHSNLTGIIGPNGCGKSNVVDAIKWVLGDQRARSLRGQEMTDVIFKGAEGRDPMGMAEVVLTLEDADGRFDGRTEIDIGRRLTVNKESEYLLNGSPVRLKDVRDVLMDTGLGVGAYSVMEQGRIDAVLSADPESRRAIFEEAAGISRFKLQKRESLRRLERTEQNLARVHDLLEDRARRIRSLKIQAGKARRWQELQGQLRELRSALAVLEGRGLRAALAEQRERMASLSAGIADADREREAAAAALSAVDEKLAAEAAALEELQGELHRCEADRAGAQSRLESQLHRIAELENDATAYRQRREALDAQTEERRKATADARALLAAREDELVALHRTLEARQAAAAGAQKSLRALQAERETLRDKLLECIHERTRARNRAHDQEAQLRAVGTRQQRLRERLDALAAELQGLGSEQQALGATQESLDRRERELGDQEQHALHDLQEADSAAGALARQETELRYQLSQVEGRKHALEDMEAHMEGLDQGARWVLETRPEGLRGRLLDLLETDLEFGPALEAVLGPYAQALVFDTRKHAEDVLGRLHEDKRGRVLLLVREEFGPDLDRVPDLPLPEGARFLSQCVRTTEAAADAESRRMVHWLLRGVCLVDDLGAARGDRADLCFVTRSGMLLCGPRLEGGIVEGQAGLVVRRSHIQALGERANVLHRRLEMLQQGKDRASGRVDELKQQVRSIADAVSEVRQKRQEAMGERARLQGRAADLERERSELALEEHELVRTRCAALAELGRHLTNAWLVERREQRLHGEEREQEAKLERAQDVLQEAAAEEQEMRLRLVACRESRDGLHRNIGVHEEALGELDKAAQHLDERLKSNAEGAARAQAEVERLEGEVQQRAGELDALQERRGAQQEKLEALRGDRTRCQEEVRSRDEKRSAIEEERTATRLQISETEHKFARSEERLREETGVELRRCLGKVQGWGLQDPRLFPGPPAPADQECLQGPPLDPEEIARLQEMRRLWEDPAFDAPAARREVQVLQSKRDRLGAVNLDAVEELADEEQQFVHLEHETEDLKEARRSLIETLRRLETESRALFEETFAAARENFQQIFRKLFQGGRADMFLDDPENALESGIEIVARPPGKELQSINLLSGGERSMTALAILFAVFKVKPSPFCVLDEVDAALDDTNVERFLRVLRDFLGETQFCIVTHHKRTMAECQTLYGVTMQRRGVSSRIAVSLEEVDTFQEGAKRAVSGVDDYAAQRRVAGEERIGF